LTRRSAPYPDSLTAYGPRTIDVANGDFGSGGNWIQDSPHEGSRLTV
jgi:hypothetical protein